VIQHPDIDQRQSGFQGWRSVPCLRSTPQSRHWGGCEPR
jgi:hypothetical protein